MIDIRVMLMSYEYHDHEYQMRLISMSHINSHMNSYRTHLNNMPTDMMMIDTIVSLRIIIDSHFTVIYAIVHYTILYCTVLYYTILYYNIL